MKSKLIVLPLLAFAALAFLSFAPTETTKATKIKSGVVTASIDGKSWTGENVKLAMAIGGQLHIEVMAPDDTGIKLALFGADKPGIVKVGGSNMSICAYLTPEKSFASNVLTKAGQVEITEISASGVKGTFEFQCGDDQTKIEVTDGSFDVKF